MKRNVLAGLVLTMSTLSAHAIEPAWAWVQFSSTVEPGLNLVYDSALDPAASGTARAWGKLFYGPYQLADANADLTKGVLTAAAGSYSYEPPPNPYVQTPKSSTTGASASFYMDFWFEGYRPGQTATLQYNANVFLTSGSYAPIFPNEAYTSVAIDFWLGGPYLQVRDHQCVGLAAECSIKTSQTSIAYDLTGAREFALNDNTFRVMAHFSAVSSFGHLGAIDLVDRVTPTFGITLPAGVSMYSSIGPLFVSQNGAILVPGVPEVPTSVMVLGGLAVLAAAARHRRRGLLVAGD